jgi:GNAT superfamily N-acetyltransferase
MTVTVRRARPGDGDGIARAWQGAAASYAGPGPRQFQGPSAQELAELWDNEARQRNDDTLQLVAELGGRVAGWLLARVWSDDDTGQPATLTVDLLLVELGHQRQGAGTALMEAAESWGRARGAQVARLATFADSPVSVPFYEQRMGYQRHTIIFEKRLRPSDP